MLTGAETARDHMGCAENGLFTSCITICGHLAKISEKFSFFFCLLSSLRRNAYATCNGLYGSANNGT